MTDQRRIVIVGCGAGGGTAAQFARKTDRKAEITVIEKGPYTQYSKCGLPYTISGRIPDVMNLIEFTPEFFKKMNVELLLNTEVTGVDVDKKVVKAVGSDGEVIREFDELILATGANPFVPPIKNVHADDGLAEGVFVVRTIEDAKAIAARVKKGAKAVVVGAGLIGLEVGEALVEREMDVTVVEALASVLANTLDPDMAKMVQKHLEDHGMRVMLDAFVTEAVVDSEGVQGVVVKAKESGEIQELECSLLIVATGTRPEIRLAEMCGCEIGGTGGVIVDEHSRSSVDHVYVVGDCSEYADFVTGTPLLVGLGSIVVRQAIAAAVNAAGGQYDLPAGVLLTRTSEFFGLQIAGVGPMVERCEDLEFVQGKFSGHSLPEYVPGGIPIDMKVGVDVLSGEVIAAQAVGSNAAQRVNVFAASILGGLLVDELRKLETAYAPAVAPTLDVVTLACDVAAMKLARKKR